MKKLLSIFCLICAVKSFAATNTVPNLGATTNIAKSVLLSTNFSYPLVTFAGPTNTFSLNNTYQYYVTAANVAITNFTGLTNGFARWSTLQVSNSSGSSVTAYFTAGSLRKGTSSTTNALDIAAGKIGIVSFLSNGTNFVSYVTACEP